MLVPGSHRRVESPRYFPLVLVVCALAGGIVLDRYWPVPAALWWFGSVGFLAAWLALWFRRQEKPASALLLAGVLAAGGAWHHVYWRYYPANEIGRMVDETFRPLVVEATAITSPRWSPAPPPTPLRTIPKAESCELLLWITAVRDGPAYRPASGWATLDVAGRLDTIQAGDRLRVLAQGARPAPPLNPGEFDFSRHERSRRVSCRLFADLPECVQLLSRGPAWSPRRWLAEIRSGGAAMLRRYIAPERATLASAILLGTREQLDPDRNEGYLVTGTIHILSISGLHVGILAAGFFVLLRRSRVQRGLVLAATAALTIGYAFLTDLEPPIVRASILVVAICWATWLGRTDSGTNALAAAGILVLAWCPASLFQTGPQLSFLAVATMVAFQPLLMRHVTNDPLERLIATTRPWIVRLARRLGSFLWRIWLTGALIWLVSLPLVWKQYNLISPVALVLNFLMWIPVSVAMYAGMGTLVLGSLWPLAGRLCGLACDWALSLMEQLITSGRDWPGSYTWLAAPPVWWIAIFYMTVGFFTAFPPVRPSRRWLGALLALWLAAAFLLSSSNGTAFVKQRPLVCHFVSVGHGICTLVELPSGRKLLYDAGRTGSPLTGVRPISAVLWSRGIKHLDALVISHADADHFNAIPDLLDRFSVGAIYVSPIMFEDLPPAVKELHDAIVRSGVPIREIYAGQRLAGGETAIEVLHPPRKGVIGSDNANSIVLKIDNGGRRILLTGDLEPPGLQDVLAEEPLDCDLVLAPHHGSPRSDPGGFADWATPEFVVISGSRSLGDIPTIERVKDSFRVRGAEVLHTAEDGCIRVVIARSGLQVTTYRPHVRAAPEPRAGGDFMQTE